MCCHSHILFLSHPNPSTYTNNTNISLRGRFLFEKLLQGFYCIENCFGLPKEVLIRCHSILLRHSMIPVSTHVGSDKCQYLLPLCSCIIFYLICFSTETRSSQEEDTLWLTQSSVLEQTITSSHWTASPSRPTCPNVWDTWMTGQID